MAGRLLAKSSAIPGFIPDVFDQAVRDFGYLLNWSSAELCPCRSNSQTDEIDPTCDSCDGSGFIYLAPTSDQLCTYRDYCPPFSPPGDAVTTQGIITQQSSNTEIYEKMGEWTFGTARLTTFSWCELGYRDRFEHLESLMTYRQVLRVDATKLLIRGNDARTRLRYKVVKVLRAFVLRNDVAVTLDPKFVVIRDDATLDLTGTDVKAGEYVSVSYRCHPIWIITEFPVTVRDTRSRSKTPHQVLGEQSILPVHAVVKLDYLLGPTAQVET